MSEVVRAVGVRARTDPLSASASKGRLERQRLARSSAPEISEAVTPPHVPLSNNFLVMVKKGRGMGWR